MLKSRSVLNTVEGIPKVFWCSMFIHVLPPSAAGLVGVGRNHIFHQNNGVLPVLPNMQNCSSKSWLRRTSLLTFYQLTAGTAGLWHLLLTHTSHFLKLSPRSVVDTSSVCWDFGKSWEVRASMGGKKLWNILKHPETSWKPIWKQQLAAASYRYFSEAEMTWSETSVDRFAEPRWKQWLRRNCAWFSNRATDQHYGLLEHQNISRV